MWGLRCYHALHVGLFGISDFNLRRVRFRNKSFLKLAVKLVCIVCEHDTSNRLIALKILHDHFDHSINPGVDHSIRQNNLGDVGLEETRHCEVINTEVQI